MITDPILGSIVAAGFFFVVVPVFWAIVIVTSAINVVLGALGLPLLPNVPDPPFGPTPQLNATITPAVETDPLASDLDAPNTLKSGLSTGMVETDPPSSDPVAPDTDTANTSKPVMNVAKESPIFTPKPHGRDSSSSGSGPVRTSVQATADNASTVEQHPVGRIGKKPKPDAAKGEQKPGDDPSTTQSRSQ